VEDGDEDEDDAGDCAMMEGDEERQRAEEEGRAREPSNPEETACGASSDASHSGELFLSASRLV